MEEQNIGNLKNQEDVNPTSQQDKIVKEKDQESIPKTNGTGSNNPVPTSGSIIIKEEEGEGEEEDQT
jgi:hypothetical protein